MDAAILITGVFIGMAFVAHWKVTAVAMMAFFAGAWFGRWVDKPDFMWRRNR